MRKAGFAFILVLAVLAPGSPPTPTAQSFDSDPLLAGPPVVLTGNWDDASFGSSVATAGDVNGDGYEDVIVGAPGMSNTTGRAYVFLGGPNCLAAAPVTTLEGEGFGTFFGISVAAAGDVNGDAYDDVVIGAFGYGQFTGRAYVYLGGPGGLMTPAAAALTGGAGGDYFGGSVAGAGDVNGDGFADVVIGARGYDTLTGRAYVFYGQANGVSQTPATTLTGEAVHSEFGSVVAPAGDVNGDGRADVLVGAPNFSSGTGRAYLYLGGASGLATVAARTLTGTGASDYFAKSLGTAGDVDADGYDDVVVGADPYGGPEGRASIYLGGPAGLGPTPATVLTAAGTGHMAFGAAVGTAGDVNGDGYSDVVVGAPYDDGRGSASLFLGGASGLTTTVAVTMAGEEAGDNFGASVAPAGDVDGDGHADVVVGARYHEGRGGAYIYGAGACVVGDFTGDRKSDILWRHGSLGEVWLWPMDGVTRVSESYVRTVPDTNWEIRGLGDQTGDGKADILWRNKGNGQIYLWQMDGAAPTAEAYMDTVETAYDIVGTGDFNSDGKSDILWRHTTLGDVWIWLMDGATSLSEIYIDRVEPGYVVKGVGDLDGDRKADIVWHHGTTGEVWIWPMDGTTRLDQSWVATVPDVGYEIVGVADFTGDRMSDLLWHHATRGEVWLWTMNGTTRVDETLVGTVPDVSYEIVGAGDYNGDGKADILWHHATLGEVWVWLMDGTTKLSETWVGTVPDVGYQIDVVAGAGLPRCYIAQKPFKADDPQQCFGAMGSRCAGDAPGAPVSPPSASCMVSAAVGVGSIRHDQCCLQDPTGFACGDWGTWFNVFACRTEFEEAAGDLLCGFTWRLPFGPYAVDNDEGSDTPDALPVPPNLLAPDGTMIAAPTLALNTCAYCRAGDCVRDQDGVTYTEPASNPQCGSFARCGCTHIVSPREIGPVPAAGGNAHFTVNEYGSSCGSWLAASNASWITLGGSGVGNSSGQVPFTVAANPGDARSGTLTIAGQVVTVNQVGGAAVTCASVAGTWAFALDEVVTCTQTGSSHGGGEGVITITQSGCSIAFTIETEDGPLAYTGTVAGNTMSFTGPEATGSGWTVNSRWGTGPMSADGRRIDLATSSVLADSYESCTSTGTTVLSR